MKKRTMMGGAAALALMLTVGTSDVVGQIGPRGDRGPRGEAVAERMRPVRPSAPAGVEGIIRLRDRLELTDEQVARLDALRSEEVARRGRDAAELGELRSQLRAGTLERAEARERIQAVREARRSAAEASRAAVMEILTEEQAAEVQELQARRRAFEAGRRSAMREGARRPDRPARPEGVRGGRGGRGGS